MYDDKCSILYAIYVREETFAQYLTQEGIDRHAKCQQKLPPKNLPNEVNRDNFSAFIFQIWLKTFF